jgi:heme-degrading monooxygenase HmoA
MIARIWRGRTSDSHADEYFEYLKRTGIKDLKSIEGNRGVYTLRRTANGEAEFLMISLWDSFDAIRNFSGKNLDKAVYYPDDKKYLLELDPKVHHFEVMMDSDDRNPLEMGRMPWLLRYMKGIKI